MINTGGPRIGASAGGMGAGAQGMNQPGGDGSRTADGNNRRTT